MSALKAKTSSCYIRGVEIGLKESRNYHSQMIIYAKIFVLESSLKLRYNNYFLLIQTFSLKLIL
jgi:hypothetical protein